MEYNSARKNELLLPITIPVNLTDNAEQNAPDPKSYLN